MKDLLFLAHRAPFPPDRGDKIRSYHVLRHLARDWRVHLCAFAEQAGEEELPPELRAELASHHILRRTKPMPVAAVQALGTGKPISLTAFAHPGMMRAVADVRARRPIGATYIFSGQMAQYRGDEPTIMDMVDVDSVKFASLAKSAKPGMRSVLKREGRLLGRYERQVAQSVAATLFVSEAEAALFRSGGGQGNVLAVENGIDASHYDPAAIDPGASDGPLIVFTGQMDYRPNIDAVTRFAEYILPLVRAACPAARFAIVGRAPTPAVRRLASEAVIVTGEVPDTRIWLVRAAVCVAPLDLARGIQNKLLEAMAMARPIVASVAAAEGIDHGGTIAVAGDDRDFAERVIAALNGPADNPAARAQVLARYDWTARLAPLDRLLGAMAA
ncbi:TIGR03087 family PEP-CTERM/XrtA system glycosyltransferase [Sphingomonas yabuuchiae]|uniref:Sugar transferase (PEP-CTERM/EpsH1 system associated) n=1 Tax=Sphingomonas yabuuchiae TaxID=172044 RepID=A0AA40ZZU0_9SPHN|nr:TIGR03087 family PEP-CTERM/XrtA system glycosyltransferase [Sphingomonas yabuuchiae]MBB4610432.1 sugar transferase (PEP-CTERM/EpsH1 system associated) [Sphingomonas yabuuchiae]MBN3558159.1 TIGR03087 family PEP-CTERM/XrtA system glycosyltransferase [Sphingomonas yabuuchiae]